MDFFSSQHPLYMFDILGCGRSSRPSFNGLKHIKAETKFVEAIEDWRGELKLNEFYLIGHGFGAFLSTLYTIKYGQYIKKLILLDPWGFNSKPEESQLDLRTPWWIKLLAFITQTWTPFSAFRFLGPLGLPALKLLAPRWKRLAPISQSGGKSEELYEYLFHCNIQSSSGDVGFQAMADWYGWAKAPILTPNNSRLDAISTTIPIAFVFGSRTWVDNTSAHQIKKQRKNTDVKTIYNAAHFFFLEKSEQFHQCMTEIFNDTSSSVTTSYD
ncbi:unnamed protein product [Didymodactylos carnosus]|uniref:AB hydrolase-1 domain-containing protein n=1 Tax=Didymodactylos carnosus TaxID=1234261 RepID=A0A813U473_9BILA|nr:unnamed protein product [Didymodactylos carnosus]CAF0956594.1 unnamed protein product [Didymodactylos carnosus]CAF3603687.1 unnamed protein product [Didymodactylos carnosus]CAF3729699.1 unnamed protein product [Didymodactylos carnosus]